MGLKDPSLLMNDLLTTPWSAQLQQVREGAERQLRGTSYLALKNVTCEIREGALVLGGCLPSYFLKQMAQTTVARVEGVRRIVNEIQVVAPSLALSPG